MHLKTPYLLKLPKDVKKPVLTFSKNLTLLLLALQFFLPYSAANLLDYTKIKKIEWQEIGSSNLSYFVNKNTLQQTVQNETNQSLLLLDLQELEERLLENPLLESVQIQKKLPSSLHIQYSTYFARALAIRNIEKKQQLWYVSSQGKWLSPVFSETLDLPILASENFLPESLLWLDLLEAELQPLLSETHEISLSTKTNIILEIQYAHTTKKISISAPLQPEKETIARLKQVIQYLIKNNILVSNIDLRLGKKVVVNVGIHP